MTTFIKFASGFYKSSKLLVLGGVLSTYYYYSLRERFHSSCDSAINSRIYSYEEVKSHSPGTGKFVWTIYRDGVYDITEFIDVHPGGEIILKAAGGYLDPFFEVYNFHESPEIMEFLEPMRIGSIYPSDSFEMMKDKISIDIDTSFAAEPERSPKQIIRSNRPYNSEPPLKYLDDYYTDKEMLFVRNHLPVPYLRQDNYSFEVCLEKKFTTNEITKNNDFYEKNTGGVDCFCKKVFMEELMNQPSHTVDSVIQCTGNRRVEFNQVESVKGLSWAGAAIGNCLWTGIKLRDILFDIKEFKIDRNDWVNAKAHVKFQGADFDTAADVHFEASISLAKALDPDTVLAYEMNGEPLTRDHGFPIRAIVPGVCGARNVKWLKTITVSESESSSRWQKEDYKLLPSYIKFGDVADLSKYAAIQNMPINCMICQPEKDSVILRSSLDTKDGVKMLKVSGYSYSGNGSAIARVQVSVNDGLDWVEAELFNKCKDVNRCWSWTLWTAYIPVKEDSNNIKVQARATDVCNNVQPERMNDIWNMRGLLNNSYSKCEVNLA